MCEDFGEGNVGFAAGVYKVNRKLGADPGEVAKILWNRLVG